VDDQACAIDEHLLQTNERPRQSDDPKMSRVGAQTLEHPTHPKGDFRGWCDPERALGIGRKIGEDEGASAGQICREAHERVQLSRSVGEARQGKHAERKRDFPRDRMGDRGPDVGESETLWPMDGLIRFRARGDQADRHRIEARITESPECGR
jgi:hypothetical protein